MHLGRFLLLPNPGYRRLRMGGDDARLGVYNAQGTEHESLVLRGRYGSVTGEGSCTKCVCYKWRL